MRMAPGVTGSADISEDGVYRYRLHRSWGAPAVLGYVCWIMLNPSTADGKEDDPTIKRCIQFTRAWGRSRLVVVNLYALRATDPVALTEHDNPVGPLNDYSIRSSAESADIVVAAWGVLGRKRGPKVRQDLRTFGIGLSHLGLTKGGQPRHPLYLKSSTPLVRWS